MVFDTSWLVLAAVSVTLVDGKAQPQGFDSINMNDALEQPDKIGFEPLKLCNCVSTSGCRSPRNILEQTCGAGKYLCCYKRNNQGRKTFGDFYNDIGEEPQMLYPGREKFGGPFPPPDAEPKDSSLLVGLVGPAGYIGLGYGRPMVESGGPTGLNEPRRNFGNY